MTDSPKGTKGGLTVPATAGASASSDMPAPALLHPGTTVYAQWYGRDNGLPLPNNINLSDGLRFVIQP